MADKSMGAFLGDLFKLNVEVMVRNFKFFAFGAVFIGGVTGWAVYNIGSGVKKIEEEILPKYNLTQNVSREVGERRADVLRATGGTLAGRIRVIAVVIKRREGLLSETGRVASGLSGEVGMSLRARIERTSEAYFSAIDESNPRVEVIIKSLDGFNAAVEDVKSFHKGAMDEGFAASRRATTWAFVVVIGLSLGAIVNMIVMGIVLSAVIGVPVSTVTEKLLINSRDIEEAYGVISEGTKKQTDVVQAATQDLEDMIINTIQGSISMSVEKQVGIAKSFSDFLKQFVERTSAEIAMGLMSIAQQSTEARKGVEHFVEELAIVEENIKIQHTTIDGVVGALKTMVEANKEIRVKAASSTAAADKATNAAYAGQERLGVIAHELEEIKVASEGVKEITESLAKITEDIKILALNMSLKVEDIKDDTGKSYGFEAMSTRVQNLAEEVERLLKRSTELINPTIDAIGKVDLEARDTLILLEDVANTIKTADEETKAIGEQIDRQATEIDRVEVEAENLKAIAEKTTLSVEAQATLIKEVGTLLEESDVLIESVNLQTVEASDGARKVNDMMKQLTASVRSIEDGTGILTEKSAMISEMFDTIREQAVKNLGGVERLEGATNAVRDVSNQLSIVVKGSAA